MLLKEVKNILIISVVLGILQIIAAALLGYFSFAAVLGTALGIFTAVFNFFLMGVFIQKSLSKGKAASVYTNLGYIFRLALIAAVIIWSMKAEYLNYVCVIIPLAFPTAAIFILNAVRNKNA